MATLNWWRRTDLFPRGYTQVSEPCILIGLSAQVPEIWLSRRDALEYPLILKNSAAATPATLRYAMNNCYNIFYSSTSSQAQETISLRSVQHTSNQLPQTKNSQGAETWPYLLGQLCHRVPQLNTRGTTSHEQEHTMELGKACNNHCGMHEPLRGSNRPVQSGLAPSCLQ